MTDATPILEQALCFHDACPDCVKAGRCLSAQLAHEDWGEDVAAQLAALAKAGLEIRPVDPLAGLSEPGREPEEIEPFQKYRATIRFRRNRDNGEPWLVWPYLEPADGSRLTFRAAWEIGEDDAVQYLGEWAMLLEDRAEANGIPIGWIASGDLVDWVKMP